MKYTIIALVLFSYAVVLVTGGDSSTLAITANVKVLASRERFSTPKKYIEADIISFPHNGDRISFDEMPIFTFTNRKFIKCQLDCESLFVDIQTTLFNCSDSFRYNTYPAMIESNVGLFTCPQQSMLKTREQKQTLMKAISICQNINMCKLTAAGSIFASPIVLQKYLDFSFDGRNEQRMVAVEDYTSKFVPNSPIQGQNRNKNN
ncbi:hypothetical protein AKO1_009268 [Acrasis kona]|uniref:Uncharacterized protein n=1 Tax=Acrasis kona TaxID=1008807 RepID=A0AAW2ZKA4_9EUKA